MTQEINHPELVNKCIRCKNTSGELNNRSIIRILGTKIVKPFKINISVCNGCTLEVSKIFKKGDLIDRIRKLSIILLPGLIILLWIIVWFEFASDWSSLIITIIISFVLIFSIFIINLGLASYYRLYVLGKYLKIEKDGRVVLKDPINKKKSVEFNILKFSNKRFAEKSSKTYEFCPNCGSSQKSYSGFCADCGKSLKI